MIFEQTFDLGLSSSTSGTRRLPRKSPFATTATASYAHASPASATSTAANAASSPATGSTASLAEGVHWDGDQVARQFRICR